VAFGPDGRLLAAGAAVLWGVRDPAHPVRRGSVPTGSADPGRALAFSPDGSTRAGADQTLRLWSVADPAHAGPLGRPLTAGHTAAITSVAYDPTGGAIASVSTDRSVRLLALDPGRATERICASTANTLDRRQWSQYIPELPFGPPCR
jgi:WD40 repeat protein